MMANTASAIYDAAYKMAKTSEEGIPPDIHVDSEGQPDGSAEDAQAHQQPDWYAPGYYSINVGDMNLTMEGFMT